MYAVIETGGKQYRVEVGTELEVELLDAEPGQSLTLERVLLVADGDEAAVGRPVVPNATVEAEVVRRDRGEKLIVFKYRPKARRRVKKGHRQDHSVIRITDVKLDGRSAAEDRRRAEQDAADERRRLEEAAARQAAADAELAARLAAARSAAETATREKGTRGRSTEAGAAGGRRARTPAREPDRPDATTDDAANDEDPDAGKPGRTRKDE